MKKKVVSDLIRRTLFQFLSPDGEACAELNTEIRSGNRWLTSVWVGEGYRKQGLARQMVTAFVSEFGSETIYLHVLGFDARPVTDDKLKAFYQGFGFIDTEVPGVMVRKAV